MARFMKGPGRGWRLANYAAVAVFCVNGVVLAFGGHRPWWLWGVQFLLASASLGFQLMRSRREREAAAEDRQYTP